MLRRLAALSVLLLSLSGVMPTALACAPSVQAACCPAGVPHDPTGGAAPHAYSDGPCCVAEVGSESIAAAVLEAEPRVTDLPSPDQPSVLPTSAVAASDFASSRATTSNVVSRPDIHQQVYLLTGRLRL